jgi:hypothetical protein
MIERAKLDIVGKLRETASMGCWKIFTIVALGLSTPASGAEGEDDIRNMGAGRLSVELRPRYNHIDESDKPRTTEGGTGRAIVGWRGAPFDGLRLAVEAIHAERIGPKRYNDDPALLAASPYPLLPDPRYTGVNQAYVEYEGVETVRVRLGRQGVRMDNERWVSDNDFRQLPQLFDGITVAHTGFANTRLTAGYFRRVRTTSGERDALKLTLLNAAWNPAPGQALAAYGYFHDQAANGAFTGFADNSYRVLGARAEGSVTRIGEIEFPYLAEIAQQKNYAGGDARIDARYWRLGAGVGARAWTARFDYEVKGSNQGLYGLQMPLTDFYAFNGWTLHFFNTPRTGLRDRWLTARYALGDFTVYGEAHRFRSDFGAVDLGRELDVGLTYEWSEHCVVRLQHAKYDPGAGTPDASIRKTWLTLTFTY